jgi:predicted nucleic acid-binding protein
VEILPEGAKTTRLREAARVLFAATRASVLPFGNDEAVAYGRIMATRRASGRPLSSFDAQIAATAASAGATVATRNTRDFADCGVSLTNPYSESVLSE